MTVEELKVILELETKGFNKQAESAKRSLNDTEKAATSLKDKLKKIFGGTFAGLSTEANKAKSSMANSMSGIAKESEKVNASLGKTRSIMKDLKIAAWGGRLSAGLIDATAEAKSYMLELTGCEQAVEQLSEILKDCDPGSEEYAEGSQKVAEYTARINELKQKLESMPNFGTHGLFQDTGQISNIRTLKAQMGGLRDYVSGIRSGFTEVFQVTPVGRFATRVGSAFTGIKRFIIGAKNDIGTFGKKILDAGKHFGIFGRRAGNAGSSVKNFIKSALGIGSLVVLFNKLKSAASEGFNNLSQYSGRTSSDLAMLRGSLTQVKNSLATAFAPIVTVIAPLIQTLVNYITTACNALAMFFGALTGQKTVSVAKANFGDIAAGASGAADATGAANGAAEEYQRTLMGFDQINKLDDNSGSGGSGGGGAGGVGGAAGFTTAEISNAASGWADKVKEAWKNADFYGIGQSVGQRLKAGLDSIDWSRVKGIGEKIARSIATGLNGFLEAPGLFSTIGKTIAQSLNTVFNTANTFAKEFHWESLGTAISDTINSFFSTFDFTLAGQTVFNWASGILRSAISAVKNVDWALVGEKIAEFIAGIDWAELISEAIELAKLAIKGVAEFTLSFVKNIAYKLFKWAYDLVHARSEATLKVNLKGKKDKSFTKVYKEYESTNDKPATVELKGKKHYSWAPTQKDFNSIKDSTATKTLRESGGSTIRSVKGVYDSIKSNSATKTVYGSTTSSMKDTKWYFDNVYNKSATMYLYGSVSSAAERVYTIVRGVANTVTNIALGAIRGIATGGLYSNGSWKPITAAAGGGAFNTGQMFVAREAGPELVGTIGGHTAVMNNDQIVSSVAAGVARAVASVMGSIGGQTAVVLEGDAQNLFRVIRTEARNYVNATGRSPFPV